MLADIREDPREGGEPTLSVLQRMGGNCLFIPTDVSVWDEVDRLVSQTVEQFGRLDVMVNNAATSAGKPLSNTTLEDWDRVIATSLTGVFYGCKRAVRQMLSQPMRAGVRGRIVNIPRSME